MNSFKVLSICFVATFVSANPTDLADSYGGNGGGLSLGSGYGSGLGLGNGLGLLSTTGLLGGGLGNGLGSGLGNGLGSGLGNGLGSGLGNGYGSGLGNGLGSGLGLSNGFGISNGFGGGISGLSAPGRLSAAIQSRRTFEVVPMNIPQEPVLPQVIEVEPTFQPVHVIFRTISSPVHVQQIHTPGGPGQVESTQSEDEPHRVLHEVSRPVIQEVREVIQPYRRVVQEVRPVLEEVHTLVAKGEGRRGLGAQNALLGSDLGGEGLANGLGKSSHYKKAAKAAKAARA